MTTSNILFCLILALPAIAIVLLIKRKYIQVGNEPPLPPPPSGPDSRSHTLYTSPISLENIF